MNTAFKQLGGAALGLMLALHAPARAHADPAESNASVQALVAQARRATAAFHDIRNAFAAGYGPAPVVDLQGNACIEQPGQGAMGIHFAHGGLFTAHLDARTPQVLMYEPKPDGSLRLVGVEYLVIKATWDGAFPGTTPRLYGQDFHLVAAGNRYGLPDFYALHVWMWQPNRNGLFNDWNPEVRCP